jgi:glutaredoxin
VTLVTLYTRPGCHLCEEAKAVIERVQADIPFELRELDIERDDALLRRYLERIPVVEIEGVETFELDQVQESSFRERLARVIEG